MPTRTLYWNMIDVDRIDTKNSPDNEVNDDCQHF